MVYSAMKLCLLSDTVFPLALTKKITQLHSLSFYSLSFEFFHSFSPQEYDIFLIFTKKSSHLFLKNYIKNLQKKAPSIPLFLWLGKSGSLQRAEYLKLGVKDCFSGSLCIEELLLKMKVFTEKKPLFSPRISRFTHGKFSFCFISKKALYKDKEIFLTKKETLLLECLLRQPERTTSREFLHQIAWSSEALPSSNVLETYMSRLRKKIEKRCRIRLIHTVWGVGYRIKKAPSTGGFL